VDGRQQLYGVVAAGAGGSLAALLMRVAQSGDAVVALPGVGDDGRAGLHVVGDEGMQRGGGHIGQRRVPLNKCDRQCKQPDGSTRLRARGRGGPTHPRRLRR
jgi:hypothetical protein